MVNITPLPALPAPELGAATADPGSCHTRDNQALWAVLGVKRFPLPATTSFGTTYRSTRSRGWWVDVGTQLRLYPAEPEAAHEGLDRGYHFESKVVWDARVCQLYRSIRLWPSRQSRRLLGCCRLGMEYFR